MLIFSHKQQQRIPLELMDPILAFIFPAWLSSRKDLKIKEIPELKKLLGETGNFQDSCRVKQNKCVLRIA